MVLSFILRFLIYVKSYWVPLQKIHMGFLLRLHWIYRLIWGRTDNLKILNYPTKNIESHFTYLDHLLYPSPEFESFLHRGLVYSLVSCSRDTLKYLWLLWMVSYFQFCIYASLICHQCKMHPNFTDIKMWKKYVLKLLFSIDVLLV